MKDKEFLQLNVLEAMDYLNKHAHAKTSVVYKNRYGKLIRETIDRNGTHCIVLTGEEIESAWDEDGTGHDEAVERGSDCVVVKCTKEQAIDLSLKFHGEFAIKTCANYNGDTLSLYCGFAGRESRLALRIHDICEAN